MDTSGSVPPSVLDKPVTDITPEQIQERLDSLRQFEIVVVEWEDACIQSIASVCRKDDPDLHLMHGVSIGHLIQEDDKMISIAVDCFLDTDWPYRQCSSIPKACITRIQRLTVTTERGE